MVNLRELSVKEMKEVFIKGLRVELVEMVGEPDMPRGLQGVIDFVDDIGNIHVKWDNCRTLALIYGKDSFIILG